MKKISLLIALAAFCFAGAYAVTPGKTAPADSVVKIKRTHKGAIKKKVVKIDTSKKAKMYHY
ncbi:hypothetical protein KXQ82_00335 [Mucilaginibacter sp. HMF5004]|uniref:hypothetical protein n=1 Tax=Mucilaginibacter rivuli TaxID=2857527 RepID=UPI001C5EE3B6|nr:hypothetical protein [Mucilaginibacter rivuli]MBW4888133.1 hypothetical protein [Mucilaginibacter rivuli]